MIHYEASFRKGTPEPGSSGASILYGPRWPMQYAIGVTSGGFGGTCATRRLDAFFGSMAETADRYRKFRVLLGLE